MLVVGLSIREYGFELGGQDPGAGGLAGEALEQSAGLASVDDVGGGNGGHGEEAGFQLGDHAAPGDVGPDQYARLSGANHGHTAAGGVEDAFNVGEEDEIGGGEGVGDAAGDGVAVDVEEMTVVLVDADGGYQGDEAGVEGAGDRIGVDAGDFADEAEFRVGDAALEEGAVDATEADDAGTEVG